MNVLHVKICCERHIMNWPAYSPKDYKNVAQPNHSNLHDTPGENGTCKENKINYWKAIT